MKAEEFKNLRTTVYNHITKTYKSVIKDEDSKKIAENVDKKIMNYINKINKNKHNNDSKFILNE